MAEDRKVVLTADLIEEIARRDDWAGWVGLFNLLANHKLAAEAADAYAAGKDDGDRLAPWERDPD